MMPVPVGVYYWHLSVGPGKFGFENTSELLVLTHQYFCSYDFSCDIKTASINHIISMIGYLEYKVILQNYKLWYHMIWYEQWDEM